LLVLPTPPKVKPGVRLDDLPVAETELELLYKVLIHNDGSTCPRQQEHRVFRLVAA